MNSSFNSGYTPKTVSGHEMFEVSSAFQKAVRLGDEKVALWCAVELFNSNFGEYCWKRMRIISSEDVGIAEPNISANIHALYEMYAQQVKKSDGKHNPERLFLLHAVVMLCRAKKSRLLDWLVISCWDNHDASFELPDYAFDKHNLKGRRMGRGWEHFFDEGTKLNNHEIQDGEEEAKAIARSSRVKNGSPNNEAIQDELL